jgi:hypothetical protein
VRFLIAIALVAGCAEKKEQAAPSAASGSAPAATAPAAPAATGDMPAECAEYTRLLGLVAKCDQITPEQRADFEKAHKAIETGLHDIGSLPPEAQQGIIRSCAQGSKTVRRVASKCELP